MADVVPGTLQDLLAMGRHRLQGRVDNPRKEALDLLASFVGGPLEVLISGTTEVDDDIAGRYEAAITRRMNGEPAGYVVGSTGFRTCTFEVDENVLIPRPETEGLVGLVLKRFGRAENSRGASVWDLGTGSGCIAATLAVEGNFETVVATDVSAAALAVARNNARLNGVGEIDFRLGAFFEPVAGEKFDVIVSNPPYIAPGEYRDLDSSVRDFEPRTALESREGGMFHLRTILSEAGQFLNKGGMLALELDSRRASEVASLAASCEWQGVVVEKDVFGRPRFLLASRD